MNDPLLLRQRIHEALLQIAQETGAYPTAVLLEALAVSAMALTALEQERAMARIYDLAVKSGRQLRHELVAEQATMTA